ncbi:hypothetical protein DMENIID0001_141990 [Sergentomyia squamirostris]
MSGLNFVKSQMGTDMLVDEGYVYCKNKVLNGKTFWKCTLYKSSSCRGRVHTFNSEVVKRVGTHTHDPNEVEVRAREARKSERVVKPSKQGGKYQLPPVISLDDFEIPEGYKSTSTGENMLMYDSGVGLHRIIIFGTQTSLEFLVKNRHWVADGATGPHPFMQLYTIHVYKNRKCFPAVFIFMNQMTTSAYLEAFNVIKTKAPELNPSTIMTDFDQAALEALSEVFPSAVQNGSYSHYSQCLFLKSLCLPDLQDKWSKDMFVEVAVRKLAALIFVPPSDVKSIFREIILDPIFNDTTSGLYEFMEYIAKTWVGVDIVTGNPMDPIFSISLWNCYEAALNDLPKTSNAVMSWHRCFAKVKGASKRSVWNFLDAVTKDLESPQPQERSEVTEDPSTKRERRKLRSTVSEYNPEEKMKYVNLVGLTCISFQIMDY